MDGIYYQPVVHMLAADSKNTLHGPWAINQTATNNPSKVTCLKCLEIIKKGEKTNAK